jgi:hypothetical protein
MKDGKELLNQAEDPAKLSSVAQQITLEKKMPVRLLQPGKYTLQINVTDKIKNQTVSPSTTFEVR